MQNFPVSEMARKDFVLSYPGEPVDRVRDMMLENTENVVVVEASG
ncbi:MAG TPA: hypothetical protein VHX11_00405 [Acidobacteriaceae bacterium]|jgi:hypothetical protein|nr:hypothetical protein [Acidobacteriaceae bacterium]